MDNSKDQGSKIANNEENPSNNSETLVGSSVLPVVGEENGNPNRSSSVARTPFTNLSQVDADLALARTLQDQAYARALQDAEDQEMAARFLALTGINEMVTEEDDDIDDHGGNSQMRRGRTKFMMTNHLDLQEEPLRLQSVLHPPNVVYIEKLKEIEVKGNRMLLTSEFFFRSCNLLVPVGDDKSTLFMARSGDGDDGGCNSDVSVDGGEIMKMVVVRVVAVARDDNRDTWDDVDPDELSYEELLALGEVVGTESRGLSADSIASLRSVVYKTQNSHNGSSETCVICRLDYEDGDNLILLSCKHSYHSECITNWLQINKVCPVCSTEVSTSGSAS
ncbi:hypothetical protein Ccrd_001193 [Cynara cardunculus var. scolymus]|uniref:RING-type domain-containing protein n=1 Tax=Cynara cardunculus var. scolymus TaxID=59895 RepID=A0A118JXP5_CYNCS|nr:hypothetical protein Ccrd_001193 [Cynara cardunculus var. scolymus]